MSKKKASSSTMGSRAETLTSIAATVDDAQSSRRNINDVVIGSVQKLYSEEQGLKAMFDDLKVPCQRPSQTVTVMIIGNHSAGKSSFINWYCGQKIQSVGVAIETQGFTLIHPGRKRETLKGPATRMLFPQFEEISKLENVEANLTTEIIPLTDTQRPNAHLITFLDTPGLVDGHMAYPFDVDTALVKLGEFADLILIFLDPIGQALCSRTMHIVSQLNDKYGEKLRFYLSKADSVPNESDRNKVLIQITQNLSSHLRNRTFDLPTIYIPALPQAPALSAPAQALQQQAAAGTVPNHIEELCEEMDKTVRLTVQALLSNLSNDCEAATAECNRVMARHETGSIINRRNFWYRNSLRALCILLAVLLFFTTVFDAVHTLAPGAARSLRGVVAPVTPLLQVYNGLEYLSDMMNSSVLITALVLLPSTWFLASLLFKPHPDVLKGERLRQLTEYKETADNARKTKDSLYRQWLLHVAGEAK